MSQKRVYILTSRDGIRSEMKELYGPPPPKVINYLKHKPLRLSDYGESLDELSDQELTPTTREYKLRGTETIIIYHYEEE